MRRRRDSHVSPYKEGEPGSAHAGRRASETTREQGIREAAGADCAAVVAAAGGRRLLPGSPVARRGPVNPPTARGGQPMGARRRPANGRLHIPAGGIQKAQPPAFSYDYLRLPSGPLQRAAHL